MGPLTRWILSHRRLVAALWLILTVVGFATVQSATNALSLQFSVPGREGYETNLAILRTYHNGGNYAPELLVVQLPQGTTVDSPGIRRQLASALATVQRALPIARVVSYASTGDRTFVSRDGGTTFALVFVPGDKDNSTQSSEKAITAALTSVTVGGAPLYLTGFEALSTSSGGGNGPGVLVEALFGGVGALIVLAFVFGSFLALVPLFMAIVAIPTTFLLVWGVTTITDVSFIVQFLIALIGLGVAIDYSLLIVLRWREERARGVANELAVQRAMETAGSAVVFSGTTVAIGLLALVVLPVPFLRSVGYGGMLIPLVTVVVAITLLPVILASIGPWMDWPRRRTRTDTQSGFWTAWAGMIVRRRWIATGAALLILAALLSPLGQIVIGQPQVDSLARSGDAYVGLKALERADIGPGALGPFEVLTSQTGASALAATLSRVGGVRGAIAPAGPSWQRAGTAIVLAVPIADGSSADGRATLDRVRTVTHAAPGGARVGGPSAFNADFVSAVYGNFPLMIALIVVVTLILLARAFRSLLLPLKAVILNIISVGASWGVMTFIWQEGHGSKAIWGIPATNSITSWVPLMVFAFLFGLSMDYEVFILSRVREEYDHARSTNAAVITGVGRTGRLVTSAAIILFLAFVSLGSGPEVDIKVLATGLAAGILIDATVIRMLLVPALVSLFGRWNWWLPALPARLLRVSPSLPHLETALDQG